MRWILLDRFTSIERGRRAQAVKNISRAEEYLIEEFPNVPIVPSSLMIEMMAQVAGVLVGATTDFAKEVIIAKVTQAGFPRPVTPPAHLVIEGELEATHEHDAVTRGRITSDGELVAEATIFFGLLDRLGDHSDGPVVFSREFMESFSIREIIGRQVT